MTAPVFSRLARQANAFAAYCAFEAALRVSAKKSRLSAQAMRASVDPNAVRHKQARPVRIATARKEAMYLACMTFNLSQHQLARLIGVSQPLVHKAIREVEERREDPAYDRHLDELELELMETA